MADSYATNQWFNLPSGVAGGPLNDKNPAFSHTNKDNPKFMFPGQVRRNLGGGNDTTIQRGFIRSLLSEIPGVNLPSRRFFFQFNPTSILRAVTVQGGMMNPLLQDPSQFSVATPGNAVFNFEILLNREMEVNSKKGVNADTKIDPDLARWLRPDDPVPSSYTPSGQAVGELGVLADLIILDSIIGQGISEDTVNALAKIYNISSTWETADTSSGASVTAEPPMSEADAQERLNTILGNSAFLVSTPVRIVFSSLFMVDGFIQSSSVLFNKFNNAMIPTMCTINIGVEAKYIGFAKKDTYLTESLKTMQPNPDSGATTPEREIADPETYKELVDALKTLPPYQIALGGGSGDDYHPDSWNSSYQNTGGTSNGWKNIWESLDDSSFLCRFGFKHDLRNEQVRKNIENNKTSEVSTITKWFYENTGIMTIEHSADVRVYRSFIGNEASLSSQLGYTASGMPSGPGTRVERRDPRLSVTKDVLLLEALQGSLASSSTFSEWQKKHAWGGGDYDQYSKEKKEKLPEYDTRQNTVYATAQTKGKSDNDARALYTEGSARNNAGGTVPVVVEITLKINASRIAPGATKPDRVFFEYVFDFVEENADDNIFYDLNYQNLIS